MQSGKSRQKKGAEDRESEKRAPIRSASLERALEADGGSNRELSERAGLSFRAMAEARGGIDAEALQGPRKRLGVASSMTRLAICLELDPADVLSELGIDPSDAAIRRQIERAREASSLSNYGDDKVLRAVRARMSSANPGPVVDIVQWAPFSFGGKSGASVAVSLARSVLGSLDPEWDREANVRPASSFVDAQERLLADDGDRPDLLLGLYDIPWRRQLSVEVIPLPGLRVRVAGLCTRKIKWTDLLAGRGNLPHAFVVEGDMGARLLNGPADYPRDRLKTLSTFNPKEIAERIQRAIERGVPPDGLLFVADGPLASAVSDSLTGLIDCGALELVDPESRWAPTVKFGFAITDESPRFASLLQTAIQEDLFGRLLPRTVYLYLSLLKSDYYKQIRLDLEEIERTASIGARGFVELALNFDSEFADDLKMAAVNGLHYIQAVEDALEEGKQA